MAGPATLLAVALETVPRVELAAVVPELVPIAAAVVPLVTSIALLLSGTA